MPTHVIDTMTTYEIQCGDMTHLDRLQWANSQMDTLEYPANRSPPHSDYPMKDMRETDVTHVCTTSIIPALTIGTHQASHPCLRSPEPIPYICNREMRIRCYLANHNPSRESANTQMSLIRHLSPSNVDVIQWQ